MKKSRIIIIALCAILVGGFFCTSQYLYKADNAQDSTVDKGVYIGGIDVGGMSAQEATDAVNAYVEQLKAQKITLVGPNSSMELTLGDMGLTAKVEEAVRKATGTAKAGNLITRFMLLKDLEGENVVIDMGLAIDKQATGNLIHDKLEELNIKPQDWGLKRTGGKFEFVEGKNGAEVDIVPSVNGISDSMVKDWQNKIPENLQYTLVSHEVAPRGSQEELAKVKDLLGSYKTSYTTSNEGRAKNVTTGCKKVNGTLLYPGDTLSVYALTSPYTIANGYGVGGAYQDGELIESIGGGICQVSTTLYNAAIRAELKITQRNAHSMTVSYVDVSEDAAIAGTYKDLRFRNDFDFPIYIEGYCKNYEITFNIYGAETRPANRTIRFENEILTTDDPETEYTLSSKDKVGYYKVTRSKYIGYTAKLWKIISIDGVDTERVQTNRSTYKSSCKKVTIGTKGATEEQLATIKAALETKDDDYIKQVIQNINKAPEPAPTPDQGTNPGPQPGAGEGQTPGNGENGAV